MVLVAGANSLYPLVVRWAVAGLGENGSGLVLMMPLAVAGLAISKSLALYGQTLLTNALSLRISTQLQNAMFGHLLAADFGQISRAPTGAWVSRFVNDVTLVRTALARALTNLVRDALTIAGAVAVMLWMDWMLALLVFALYPLVAWPVIALGRSVRRLSTRLQEQFGRLTALLTQNLAGIRLIKTYQLEAREQSSAAAAFEQNRALAFKVAAKKAQVDPLLEIAGGLAFAAILVLAGWRGHVHGAPVANLVGFIAALAVMAPAARALGTLNALWQEGAAALVRIFALLDERPGIREKPGAKPLSIKGGAVRFENVSLCYEPGVPVLDDLGFTARPGQTLALVGPSGAGKTSVLNLIPRLFDPSGGAIFIDDTPIADVTLASLRSAIALVSQEAVLFDGTLYENIAFGRPDASEEAVIAAAKDACAHDFIIKQPQGYQTRAGEQGLRLSGGQRQRIALARALLKDAPILLLDEATSALDGPAQAQVHQALERLRQGRTTIMIAHQLASVRQADAILVLDQGRVAEQGTHEQLLARSALYARLAKEHFAD